MMLCVMHYMLRCMILGMMLFMMRYMLHCMLDCKMHHTRLHNASHARLYDASHGALHDTSHGALYDALNDALHDALRIVISDRRLMVQTCEAHRGDSHSRAEPVQPSLGSSHCCFFNVLQCKVVAALLMKKIT